MQKRKFCPECGKKDLPFRHHPKCMEGNLENYLWSIQNRIAYLKDRLRRLTAKKEKWEEKEKKEKAAQP